MTLVQSLILGLLQGLTEFLPVSSSGHLVIVQRLFGLTMPAVAFDIWIHLATSLAALIVIWPVIVKLKLESVITIIIASLPAAIIGILVNDRVEILFSNLALVGVALLITAALLFSSRFFNTQNKKNQPSRTDGLLIGFFQALAIVPGISRSGSTIVAGLSRGLKPVAAFNFSFLLAIPAVIGAQTLNLNSLLITSDLGLPILITGFLSAFISGLLSLKLLRHLVIKGKLAVFAFYCFLLGSLLLTTIFFRN